MNLNDLKRVIEALIFAADAPLTAERIRETIEECSDEEIAQTVETLNNEYHASGHAFMIRQVAGGYQVTTRPEYGNWIKKLYLGRQKARLSHAALESLAIIAFKQPISRVDIAQIRGVNSDGVIGTLLERKLITISGRSEAVGRPLLYSTTSEFLEFFGINDLTELPKPREIEELIGKEGMSEEVLQALSSDKQLKLPISFEPEAAAETSANVSMPLLMPGAIEIVAEQVETAIPPNIEAGETEGATLSENEETPAASSEEETVVAEELEDNTTSASQVEEENISATLEENAAAASFVDEEALLSNEEKQSEEPPVHVVSHEEAAPLVSDNGELHSADALAEALPSKKNKERKRNKRANAVAEETSSEPEAAAPQAENETLDVVLPEANLLVESENAPIVAEIESNLEEETAGTPTAEDDTATDSSEKQAAPPIATRPFEEEVDVVAIADDELETGSEEQLLAVNEVDTSFEPVVVESSATANLKIEEPLEETSFSEFAEFSEPQVVNVIESAPVTQVELAAPAISPLNEEEQVETASIYVASEEALMELPNTVLQHEHAASQAEELHIAQLETDTPIALIEPQEETAMIAAPSNDNNDALEVDAWPEVTEVRVDEPLRIADELAPVAVSEIHEARAAAFVAATAPLAADHNGETREALVAPAHEFYSTPKENFSEVEMLAVTRQEPAAPVVVEPSNSAELRAVAAQHEAGTEPHARETSIAEEEIFFV